MTNHDPDDRSRERHESPPGAAWRGTVTDERLTDPPGGHTADTHTGSPTPPTLATPPAGTTYAQHDQEIHVIEHTRRAGPRLDRVRWSSIWAGLAVTLALYLFLQLVLVATGVVELTDATASDAWWSAGAALVAFLIGGVVTGATAVWRDADDGLLNGIVLWAVGVVALLALAAFGGGIALGSFDTADVFDDITSGEIDEAISDSDPEEAAGWALIGLTSALVASALGATVGAKMWPRRNDIDGPDEVEYRR